MKSEVKARYNTLVQILPREYIDRAKEYATKNGIKKMEFIVKVYGDIDTKELLRKAVKEECKRREDAYLNE